MVDLFKKIKKPMILSLNALEKSLKEKYKKIIEDRFVKKLDIR
jgi:hypothetical protein